MNKQDLQELLKSVAHGTISVEDAEAQLSIEPLSDLGFAKVDHERTMRQGVSEVIYGAGKTAQQIKDIALSLLRHDDSCILITRIQEQKARDVLELLETEFPLGDMPLFTFYDEPNLAIIGTMPNPDGKGLIVVAAAGTSDISVAEEAALTAEALGNRVERVYDVGVAGLHRLLASSDLLEKAHVIVAVAGMEGALPSVIGGLVSCPVIAVPTT